MFAGYEERYGFFMKRKLIAIISVITILVTNIMGTTPAYVSAEEKWPEGPFVYAESAIVMEASTGLVLYEKNIHDEHYPASITKIMTVLLALENSSLGDVITVSNNAVYDVDADSSRIWINVGEKLTMQQCLYAILLESANDCAYAVAEHVSGSVENFAKLMTEKAKSLGCKNTNFVNPHGLQNVNHYTSAYDMALITREALKNESFSKIVGTKTYQIPPTNMQSETRYLRNHHKLVMQQGYTYDGIIGGKTGYTTTSKYTLVTVAKRGDLKLICIIMKDDSIEHEYSDTENLLDYGFDNFSAYPISDTENSTTLSESPMFTRYNPLLSKTDTPIETDKDAFVVLPNTASIKDAKKEVTFYSDDKKNDNSSTSDGDDKVIGKISYTYDGKYVGGANILYNYASFQTLIKSDTTAEKPTTAPISSSTHSENSMRPIIIGCIVGFIIIGIGVYYFLVERPRLNRRKAFYRKRALRRSYKDDDFLDL